MKERGNNGPEDEAKEGKAPFAGGEVVASGAKDERESFVEEVDDAVDEAVVDSGAEGDGFCKQETEGSREGYGE